MMSFVSRQSCEGIKSEHDLFSMTPTQTNIVHSQWVKHHSKASLDLGGLIECLLPGAGDDYLDLDNTYMVVQTKVNRAVGADLDANDAMGLVNN